MSFVPVSTQVRSCRAAAYLYGKSAEYWGVGESNSGATLPTVLTISEMDWEQLENK